MSQSIMEGLMISHWDEDVNQLYKVAMKCVEILIDMSWIVKTLQSTMEWPIKKSMG